MKNAYLQEQGFSMLDHDFKLSCPLSLKKKLCHNVLSLKDFMRNIKKIIECDKELVEDNFTTHNIYGSNAIDEFKGSAFEIFVEYFVKTFSSDPRIGISDYHPWDSSEFGEDWGVDGVGKMNGSDRSVTVQCKYRSNVTSLLEANKDHISNFVAYTMTSKAFRDSQMYLFTTCKGLNINTYKHMYHESITVFGYDKIKKVIGNNNSNFWKNFYNELT